jgi:hypothetical protein
LAINAFPAACGRWTPLRLRQILSFSLRTYQPALR